MIEHITMLATFPFPPALCGNVLRIMIAVGRKMREVLLNLSLSTNLPGIGSAQHRLSHRPTSQELRVEGTTLLLPMMLATCTVGETMRSVASLKMVLSRSAPLHIMSAAVVLWWEVGVFLVPGAFGPWHQTWLSQ